MTLKLFYGRRRVRRMCDHIDSLKRMLGRANERADRNATLLRESKEKAADLSREARYLVNLLDVVYETIKRMPPVVESVERLREMTAE